MLDNKKIGNNIKRIRKEKKLSMDTLAKKLGLSNRSSISHIESGSRSLRLDTVEKIAEALEVSPFDIMGPAYFDNILDIDRIKTEVEMYELLAQLFNEEEMDQISSIIKNFEKIKNKKKLVDYSNNLVNADKCDLTAIVRDDSMKPKYNKGDRVYINFGYDFSLNDIYLVEYDNSIYIRKVFNDGYRVRLISLNDEYSPINIDIPIEKPFKIIGKVIGKKQ
nr:MAG TPA: Repressor protein CI [Caudoviricetes sp.]